MSHLKEKTSKFPHSPFIYDTFGRKVHYYEIANKMFWWRMSPLTRRNIIQQIVSVRNVFRLIVRQYVLLDRWKIFIAMITHLTRFVSYSESTFSMYVNKKNFLSTSESTYWINEFNNLLFNWASCAINYVVLSMIHFERNGELWFFIYLVIYV